MKHPIFHPREEARIGPHAHDKRLVGYDCEITGTLTPVYGEYRYTVLVNHCIATIVLESTLQKVWKRSDWGAMKNVWQPRREAR